MHSFCISRSSTTSRGCTVHPSCTLCARLSMNAGMKGVEYFFRGSGPTVWTAASSVGIRSRCRSIDPKFYGCKGFKVGTKHRGPLLIFQSGTIALPFVMDCLKTRHSLTDFMCTNFYRAKLIINNSHARIFISIKFYLYIYDIPFNSKIFHFSSDELNYNYTRNTNRVT